MDDENGRPRRRLTSDAPRRSGRNNDPWIPVIIAAIVVVAGGWFLGQGLAHILGTRGEAPPPSAAPAATQAASPQASPVETPTPTAAPLVKPAAKSTHPPARKTAAPAASPTAAVTSTPTPVIMPSPMHTATPAPKTPLPKTPAPVRTMIVRPSASPKPQPVPQTNAGETTVRAYIAALMRGDPQTAAQYLGNGEPDESFIDASTRVTSLSSTREADGSYNVSVTMQTARGPYNETFVVAPSASGPRILQKSAFKP